MESRDPARDGARIDGRPVAIHHVKARDNKAALVLAKREVLVTLECLNFFADLVPITTPGCELVMEPQEESRA